MEYNGFPSIRAFEQECAKLGSSTQRIPFHKNGIEFFVLVYHPPVCTSSSCSTWSLIDMAETTRLADGVISSQEMLHNGALRNNVDVNYLGKLARLGYYPAVPVDTKTPRLEERGKAMYFFSMALQNNILTEYLQPAHADNNAPSIPDAQSEPDDKPDTNEDEPLHIPEGQQIFPFF